ncbi:MAG: VTT domain-containing protein [Aquificaceae bacterium]|nr:VTT domain-containing protein [Aquificaceae bacterium]MCS7195948.1 VTT domain-containing protein [Aquificaceae bacterium]MCX7990202.1 VTT domain-containing protein [Aquificaceae bacterium]MDW8033317.1 VTT domain-containing protein [Aquificaceae bacterium]
MLESFFPELKRWAEEFVQEHGYTALFILSFTESIIQPVPPYPFIVSAPLFKLSPYLAGLVAFVGNILGALVAYFLARFLGESFVKRLFGKRLFLKGEALFNRYGFWAVLIGEPYKLVCWLAGLFQMPLLSFLLASLLARALRIGLFMLFGDFLESLLP